MGILVSEGGQSFRQGSLNPNDLVLNMSVNDSAVRESAAQVEQRITDRLNRLAKTEEVLRNSTLAAEQRARIVSNLQRSSVLSMFDAQRESRTFSDSLLMKSTKSAIRLGVTSQVSQFLDTSGVTGGSFASRVTGSAIAGAIFGGPQAAITNGLIGLMTEIKRSSDEYKAELAKMKVEAARIREEANAKARALRAEMESRAHEIEFNADIKHRFQDVPKARDLVYEAYLLAGEAT